MMEIKGLKKTYAGGVQALRGIDLTVEDGKTLALVGESGCGKSTLAKILIGLEKPTSGQILLNGKDLSEMPATERARHVQMIFQDSGSALNPRRKVFDIIAEPLQVQVASSKAIKEKVFSTMESVGLHPQMAERFPHMLSGGQKQRIGIARALMTDPEFIICDEPVSALDVSVQAQVLNLLSDLQRTRKLGLLFISHDLSVVKFISQKVAVMYLGQIVELNEVKELYRQPCHPYTQMLLLSLPTIRTKAASVEFESKELPSPIHPPSGCSFHPRCPFCEDVCRSRIPTLERHHHSLAACHLADRLRLEVGLN